jgi:nucleotide-binding universal stress UspA family protein
MSAPGPIVAGYNGSEQALDGLALGKRLCAGLDTGAVVLSVLTYAPTETTLDAYERKLREDEARLGAEARAALSGVDPIETVAMPGVSAAHELHDLAVARGAAAIVLGSTHRGALGRVIPGTVADRLLSAAPCPIAVAPRGYAGERGPVDSIAVAYEGSPESRVALALAAELAPALGARLELVVVADPHDALVAVPMPGGYAGTVVDEDRADLERRRMQDALDHGLETLPEGLDANGEVIVDFDPKSVILAASQRSDLLLIGSRGYGPLGRVLLGGVSSAVLRNASCPVVVTPRALVADDGEAGD